MSGSSGFEAMDVRFDALRSDMQADLHHALRRQTWMVMTTMVTLVLTVLGIGQLG